MWFQSLRRSHGYTNAIRDSKVNAYEVIQDTIKGGGYGIPTLFLKT
jgi:hypothetical protein